MKKIDLSSSPAPSPPPRKIESSNSNGPTPKIQKQISNESVDHGNLFDDVFEEEEHMLSYNRFAGLGHIFMLICSYQVRHFTQPLRARAVRVMTRTSEDVRQILTTRIAEYVFGPPPKSECTARPEELSTTPLPLVCSRVAPPILVAAVNAMLSGRSVRVVVVVNRLYKSCVVTLTNVNHCKHTHRYCS